MIVYLGHFYHIHAMSHIYGILDKCMAATIVAHLLSSPHDYANSYAHDLGALPIYSASKVHLLEFYVDTSLFVRCL